MPWPRWRRDDVRPDEMVKLIKKEPKEEGLKDIPVTPGNYAKFEGENRKSLPKGIIWGIIGLVVLFAGGSLASFYIVRGKVVHSISANLGTLQNGVADLQNLDPVAAQKEFSSLDSLSSGDWGSVAQNFGFLFQGGTNAIGALGTLSNQLASLSQGFTAAQGSAFTFVSTGKGGDFIKDLQSVAQSVDAIAAAAGNLSTAASFVTGPTSSAGGNLYLSLTSQLKSAQQFLHAFIPWLSAPAPHHLLVLFDNTSEMRPGGGFLGSYADVTLANGDITDISVHDIADADAAFAQKIVPPKPLQLIVAKWRPADANWFFDFPTTASKTIAFFEASSLYAQTSTTFDGAIAISPRVVSDLLSIAGPVTIGKPSTTFSADNFLVQVQKIVQNGQATDATYPKQVLRDLATAIFAKLSALSDADKANLTSALLDEASRRDIMAYFKDPGLQSFFSTYGVAGDVYELPQKFNGDYLAVVDANVGGGKSDLYVTSTVTYSAQINMDGTLSDHLTIMRKDTADKSPYWWYKTTNQDYLQIFVPPGTTLANASGTLSKKIVASVNYAKAGYAVDPLVSTVESSEQSLFAFPGVAWHADAGKQVFTTWSRVAPGATTQFSIDYGHQLFLPPADGMEYTFVFEKQAGTRRHYDATINAPLGFVFAENNLAAYSYVSDDPPGRVITTLTLKKL